MRSRRRLADARKDFRAEQRTQRAVWRDLVALTGLRGAAGENGKNGTDGSDNAVTDIKFYNDILTLRGKLFTRTGHTQVGWATIDGGEKVYGLDSVYTKNEALTLYPVWNTNQSSCAERV